MTQFEENAWTERRTEGWKDRQTLFYRTLLATARGIIKAFIGVLIAMGLTQFLETHSY